MAIQSIQASLADRLADRLAVDFYGKPVLVAGPSPYELIDMLRSRGVTAFGLTMGSACSMPQHSAPGALARTLLQPSGLVIWQLCLSDGTPPDAEAAVSNLCSGGAVVFLSLERRGEATHEYPKALSQLFARYHYFRDPDFSIEDAKSQLFCYRHFEGVIEQLVSFYDCRLWEKEQETFIRRRLAIEALAEVSSVGIRWYQIKHHVYRVIRQRLFNLRQQIVPAGSQRDMLLYAVKRSWKVLRQRGCRDVIEIGWPIFVRQAEILLTQIRFRLRSGSQERLATIQPISERKVKLSHECSTDIIVCVHNAFDDVQRCLQSVLENTSSPYSLILVDDGSGPETAELLTRFAAKNGARLIRNDEARGYTFAANQGMRLSTGDYVVLLNSDTIVTRGWLDRLICCARSGARIGMVGPLSNTASWQSIPEVESGGDWAMNLFPEGVSVEEMGRMLSHYAARLYPAMPFLNGFCLLIDRRVIEDIGVFDEENFGRGYGEENDYALRARKAAWVLALADDAYVYHAQSKSYPTERRKQLSDLAARTLEKKHGKDIIHQALVYCRSDRVIAGIRARSKAMFERRHLNGMGRELFRCRRILFLLPIRNASGGSNVVITEALAMRNMGAEVSIFNLSTHKATFERAYPGLRVPVIYGEREELADVACGFEGVVATHWATVAWINSFRDMLSGVECAYYIQDFEPYFYEPGSPLHMAAWESYTMFPELKLFTKTEWNRQEVLSQTGANPYVVGASLDIDLFRPRPRGGPEWPDRPLRIAAMIRPQTAYRQPEQTMLLLQKASNEFRGGVAVHIFGTLPDHPDFHKLVRDFPFALYGILSPDQVANFLNEMDIFLDCSSHQAMGLTALEAMACGCATIVPQNGGAITFARHESNSLIVDTSDEAAVWAGLKRLVKDADLRSTLQMNAIYDVCQYVPEAAAFKILSVLFREGS